MNKDYNDEETINSLVDKYVETGEDQYKMDLLKSFDPYFNKYVYILCGTKAVDITNKDTITFLRLFMNNEDRATQSSINSAAKKTIQHLRMVFSDCTTSDIYDEMVLIFLEQLIRYKPMIAKNTPHKSRISFTHFLQVNTRYRLKNLSSLRGKDALHGVYNLEYSDEMSNEVIPEFGNEGPKNLDLKWVEGLTAGDIFNQLEEFERYLLFLKYENEQEKPLSDYDIARQTGADRMAVRRRFIKIKDKIKSLIDA